MMDFWPLSNEERTAVEQAAEIIRKNIAIPCTACRYCIEENSCPKNHCIPDYFAVYNNLKRFGPEQAMVAFAYFDNIAKDHVKPRDCIKCEKAVRNI